MPPPPDPATAGVVVVVPDANPGRRYWALRALAHWFDDHLARRPTVVCWQTGPLAAGFRADTVIDAGAVNEQWAPRALATARLAPAARALKTVRLHRLLAPLAGCDRLVLGGPSTLALLDWLPDRPSRRVVLWVGDDDLDDPDELDRVLARAELLLVSGERVADGLVTRGVDPRRWHRVAEPLLEGAVPADPPPSTHRRMLVLLGAPTGVADVVGGVLAGADAAAATVAPGGAEVAWLHLDGRSRDERWTDPRFVGLEAQLADLSIDGLAARLDEVAAVVLAGPTPTSLEDAAVLTREGRLDRSPARLAVKAALSGIPVIGVGSGEALALDVDGPGALTERVRTLLTDRAAWSAASRAAVARAQPHRLDLAGAAVIDALHLGRP